MYYIQVDTTGFVCKGFFIIQGEPYKIVGELKDARKFKTWDAAYRALKSMQGRYTNIDDTCCVVNK